MANGRPYLKAENPHYEDRVIAEGDEFEIWGVVRYALHKLI
jgi:DNA polymerase V